MVRRTSFQIIYFYMRLDVVGGCWLLLWKFMELLESWLLDPMFLFSILSQVYLPSLSIIHYSLPFCPQPSALTWPFTLALTFSYLILNPLPPTPQPSLFHPAHPSSSALLITHPSTLSPHWNLSIPFFAHQPALLNPHSSPHLFFTLSTIYFPLLSPYSLCHPSSSLCTFHSSPHSP